MVYKLAIQAVVALVVVVVEGAKVKDSNVLRAEGEMQLACSTVGQTGCPSGTYMQQGCYNCYVNYQNNIGSLTCNCPSSSTLGNAFACNGAIQNINGQLTCVLPRSSTTNGYLQVLSSGLPACTGCSAYNSGQSSFNMNCQLCTTTSGVQYFGLSIFNPNNCANGVAFQNGALVCGNNPTPPTPSPQNVAPQCVGTYWPNVQRTGEYASYKSCNYGQSNWYFTSQVGCEQQNFCCWNAQTNTCNTPIGVPNCPTLTTSNACANQGNGFCQWTPVSDCSTGNPPQKFCNQGGVCARICPGNEFNLCPNS